MDVFLTSTIRHAKRRNPDLRYEDQHRYLNIYDVVDDLLPRRISNSVGIRRCQWTGYINQNQFNHLPVLLMCEATRGTLLTVFLLWKIYVTTVDAHPLLFLNLSHKLTRTLKFVKQKGIREIAMRSKCFINSFTI